MVAYVLHSCERICETSVKMPSIECVDAYAYSSNDDSISVWRTIRFFTTTTRLTRGVRKHLQLTFPGLKIRRDGQLHGHNNHQICLQTDFFLWGFLKGLAYETPLSPPEELLRQQDVFEIHLIAFRRCAIQCSVKVRPISMHLEKTVHLLQWSYTGACVHYK